MQVCSELAPAIIHAEQHRG